MSLHEVGQVRRVCMQGPCCCLCFTPTWGPGASWEWGRQGAAICCRIAAVFYLGRLREGGRDRRRGETEATFGRKIMQQLQSYIPAFQPAFESKAHRVGKDKINFHTPAKFDRKPTCKNMWKELK